MTKHVFSPSSMVAHVWAQRSQDWGRSSHGNFSFRGNTIFSYAEPIGCFLDVLPAGGRDPDGNYVGTVVLIDDRSWSITTSKHQSEVSGAVRHYPSFHLPNRLWRDERFGSPLTEAFHANVLAYFLNQAADLHNRAKRARTRKDWLTGRALSRLHDYRRWASIFGLNVPDLSVEGLEAELSRMAEAEEERRKVRLAEEKKREAEAKEKALAYQRDWINNPTMQTWGMGMIPVAMRLRTFGDGPEPEPDYIETSWGATFPLDHAKRAFPLLLRLVGGVDVPGNFPGYDFFDKDTTIRLGHFRIDKIGADGTIFAGCHRVPWPEVIRLARVLNLIPSEG